GAVLDALGAARENSRAQLAGGAFALGGRGVAAQLEVLLNRGAHALVLGGEARARFFGARREAGLEGDAALGVRRRTTAVVTVAVARRRRQAAVRRRRTVAEQLAARRRRGPLAVAVHAGAAPFHVGPRRRR